MFSASLRDLLHVAFGYRHALSCPGVQYTKCSRSWQGENRDGDGVLRFLNEARAPHILTLTGLLNWKPIAEARSIDDLEGRLP